jgi:signal transduction histidine kinase
MRNEGATTEEPSSTVPVCDTEPHPLQRQGLALRAAPFGLVGLVALVSVLIPHGGMSSTGGAVTSALLLAVAAVAAFRLPWRSLPRWTAFLVPLVLLSSFLALTLATSPTSGVGPVMLTPLLWCALFDRPWETAWMLAATVAAEAVTADVQHLGTVSSLRRVMLWGAVGAMIAFSTHGLRTRLRQSRSAAVELQRRLNELALLGERDRIAQDLNGTVLRHIFVASHEVHSLASQVIKPTTRQRLLFSADELDEAARALRRTVYEERSGWQ